MRYGWFFAIALSFMLVSNAMAQELDLLYTKTTATNNLAGGFTQNPNCLDNVTAIADPSGTNFWNVPGGMHSSPGFVNPLCVSRIAVNGGAVTDIAVDLGTQVAPNSSGKSSISKDGSTVFFLHKRQGTNTDHVMIFKSNMSEVANSFMVNAQSSPLKDIKALSNGSAFILFSINSDFSTKIRKISDNGYTAWEVNLQTTGLPSKLALLSNESRIVLLTRLRAYVFDTATGQLIYSSPWMDAEPATSVEVSAEGSFVVAGEGKIYSFTPEGEGYRFDVVDYGITSEASRDIVNISQDGLKMAAIEVRNNSDSRLVVFERGSLASPWIPTFERIFSSDEGGLLATNLNFIGRGNSLVLGFFVYSQMSNPITSDIEVLKKNAAGAWVTSSSYNNPGILNFVSIVGQSKIGVFSSLSDGRRVLSVYAIRRR